MTNAKKRLPKAVVLEEVEHMLSFGEGPNRIAEALGIQVGSVAMSLWRSGRPELAVMFERAKPERNHPCVDCGDRVSNPRAQRCRPCGIAQREANRHVRRAA